MNKSEFNSYSFLEMENDILRKRLKEKDKEIEKLKLQILKLTESGNENNSENLHQKQAGSNA